MPLYAKFAEEILIQKGKIDEQETITLGEECNVVVLNKLHTKLEDPGSFSIPCVIGYLTIDRTLCDLGPSVSLMPYSIFKKLDLGALQSTTISLQLADSSVKYPSDILEDVPIKASDFYVLVDFIALDIEEDAYTQVIFGRHFFDTVGWRIDVKGEWLTFDVGEHHAEFCLF